MRPAAASPCSCTAWRPLRAAAGSYPWPGAQRCGETGQRSGGLSCRSPAHVQGPAAAAPGCSEQRRRALRSSTPPAGARPWPAPRPPAAAQGASCPAQRRLRPAAPALPARRMERHEPSPAARTRRRQHGSHRVLQGCMQPPPPAGCELLRFPGSPAHRRRASSHPGYAAGQRGLDGPGAGPQHRRRSRSLLPRQRAPRTAVWGTPCCPPSACCPPPACCPPHQLEST
mmetsp:Transcript_34994/g.77848  ORF Transcript_34994/g.77848 Transcript_34994/m.77848 type:complete len:228 (+) Transcript_34994:2372-3055(+)